MREPRWQMRSDQPTEQHGWACPRCARPSVEGGCESVLEMTQIEGKCAWEVCV